MIQFSGDGGEPAEPVKSSLHTWVQPGGGGGGAAAVAVSSAPAVNSAVQAAVTSLR